MSANRHRHTALSLLTALMVALLLAGCAARSRIHNAPTTETVTLERELTGSVFIYGDNDKFFRDSKREQDPLYALQTHLTYIAPQHWWISLGAAHARGGESSIDGENKDDERRDRLYGISAGLPIGSRSSVKLAYVGRRSSEDVGKDTDSIALGYSIRF